MTQKNKRQETNEIESLNFVTVDLEALSDEDLQKVAGGAPYEPCKLMVNK